MDGATRRVEVGYREISRLGTGRTVALNVLRTLSIRGNGDQDMTHVSLLAEDGEWELDDHDASGTRGGTG